MSKENSIGLLTAVNYEERRKRVHNSQKIKRRASTPKDVRLTRMKDMIAQKRQERTKTPRRKIHKVKRYLRNHESKLKELNKNFRNVNKKDGSLKNKNFSKSFFYSRKRNIEKKIDNLYEKERKKITSKLKLLERQRFFRSEIETKEKELIIQRSQFNELTHSTTKQKQELKHLTALWIQLENEYDTKEVEISTQKQKEKLEETEKLAIKEVYDSQCLRYKLQTFKQDLSSTKLKIRRWNAMLKRMKIKQNELKVEEYKLNQRFTDAINMIMNSKKGSELKKEPLFKEILENDLSQFENKYIIDKIEENEKLLEKEKETKKKDKKDDEEKKTNKKHRLKWHEQRVEHMKMIRNLENSEIKVNNLLQVMKLSKVEEISPRYNNLIEDEKCVEIIIKQHKSDIIKFKREIETLKEEYFKETIDYKVFTKSRSDQNEDPIKSVEEETTGDEAIEEHDVNEIQAKEMELRGLRYQLAIEEENFKKTWDTHQKACNVISRIMFQLEPKNKNKAVEVDQTNFLKYLSHINLRLERMLSFIKSRNKEVENEDVLIKEMQLVQRVNGNRYEPPQSLGLKFPANNEDPPENVNFDTDRDMNIIMKSPKKIKNS